MIVAFLGDNVKTYHQNYLKLLDGLTLSCPQCQGSCHSHGWRGRHVYDDLTHSVIKVLRVKCLKCGRIHTVLPDFLRPHGRYVQCIREPATSAVNKGEAAEQVARRMGLDPETIRRWVRQLTERLELVKAALRSLLARLQQTVPLYEGHPTLKQICESIIRAIARLPASSSLFGLVNILLAGFGFRLWI